MNTQLLHALLFSWFQKSARVLPWRCLTVSDALHWSDHQENQSINDASYTKNQVFEDRVREARASYLTKNGGRDPYLVVVSEMMLQQTQVDRVIPLYIAFMKKWPTVQSLARAKLSDVLVAWKGLGYNRRARFLYELAQAIVSKHRGVFPTTEKELCELPGIGVYTARAVLSFSFGMHVGVIDTNVRRIFSRVYYGTEFEQSGITHTELALVVDAAVPDGKSDMWNQALMDFGATICTAAAPKCSTCPLQKICTAQQRAQKQKKQYAQLVQLSSTKKSKQPKTPFKETDRFFRGRMIDALRTGPLEMAQLWIEVQKHGLTDRVRFGQLIEDLMSEKLIRIQRTTVLLG